MSDIFFLDRIRHATAPNALCGHGLSKTQSKLMTAQAITVTLFDGPTNTNQIGELNISKALFLVQKRRGTFLDVNLEDFTKSLEFFLHYTRSDVAAEAADIQSPGGLGVVLLDLSVGGAVVQSPGKISKSQIRMI